MDRENTRGENSQSETRPKVEKPNRNYVIATIVIILITPLYAFSAFLYWDSPRKLTMVIISYALIVPWWLLMAESWTLEKDHPSQARKWRWVPALLQIIQAILPIICLKWWKMSLTDAFATWTFTVLYLIFALSMHWNLIFGDHQTNDENSVHPTQEMV